MGSINKGMFIAGWYALPDNFEGTMADALRSLADYFDDPTVKRKESPPDRYLVPDRAYMQCFRDLQSKYPDSRFLGNGAMMKSQRSKYVKMELGIGKSHEQK